MSLENIRVILVETSHTGNIGSTARAMKTMGLHHLYLVNPIIKPDSQAIALAAGASDIIHDAIITNSLDEAIADCGLIIGTSARSRSLPWPHVNPREAALKALNETKKHNVAFIFGRERVGLTNDELQKCHYHLSIPANPDYSSLNLAMAVQILAYELRMAMLSHPIANENVASDDNDYPLSADLEGYYNHLEKVLTDVGFIKTAHPGMIMSKLRRLYTRARPERQELNILRGIVSAFENIRHRN